MAVRDAAFVQAGSFVRGTPKRRLITLTVAGVISSGMFAVAPAAQAAGPAATGSTTATTSTAATVSTVTWGAAGAEFASASTLSTTSALAARRPAKVTVPARYVYKPKLGVRHDYCSYAPDEFPAPRAANADFRGPCARHDLCYDGRTDRKACDKALKRNLFQNCEHYYGKYNPLRAACKATALVYWAAVVAVR